MPPVTIVKVSVKDLFVSSVDATVPLCIQIKVKQSLYMHHLSLSCEHPVCVLEFKLSAYTYVYDVVWLKFHFIKISGRHKMEQKEIL